MQKYMRKPLSAALALLLVLALSITAFAAWPSFQNDNTNNGVITPGTPPPITQPKPIPIQLPNNSAWVGVDVPSVTDDRGYAYTLYNGGNTSGTSGGARLAVTNVTVSPPTEVDIQISGPAGNGFLLSTPYLTTDGRTYTLYALVNVNSNWQLYSVDVTNPTAPGTPTILAQGAGQPNTPITADDDANPTNLYFGSFTGGLGGSYYQYTINPSGGPGTLTPALIKDDFYWAGAAIVPIADSSGATADYVVFGSDDSSVYAVPAATFNTPTPYSITLAATSSGNVPTTVRTSVMYDGNYIYFTSQGSTNGILWQIVPSDLLIPQFVAKNGVDLSGRSSTSTPVLSDNGYVYVGTYNGFTSGTVDAYNPGTGATPMPTHRDTIYDATTSPTRVADPVQSSVIVWSDGLDDYIYFTTNSNNGAGYCYIYDGSTQSINAQWTFANTSGNNYSLQGMAYSSAGYVIWGDDGNNLYVAP
jgi:hypothetical protein